MLTAVNYNNSVNELGDSAFQNCVLIERFNSEVNGTVDLSGNIETVGNYAFYGCQQLTSVIIPDNIHVLGAHSFDGCRKIQELNLTHRIIQIGDYAFQGLSLLTEVVVYNSTVSIGKGAFQGCNNIVDITLPFTGQSETAEAWNAVFGYIFGFTVRYSSGSEASSYEKYTTFTNKVIERSGEICQYSSYGGYSDHYGYYYIPTTLRTVTITKQTDIPLAAFNGCTMLTKITYTNAIHSTGDYAFQNCVSPTQSTARTSIQYALPASKRESI